MRNRPPDRPLTGQEVASSNTTVNALLGGRQKSWMTGATSIVRPSPRTDSTRKSGPAVLPSPAPSDEPSPVQQPQEGTSMERSAAINPQSASDDVQSPHSRGNIPYGSKASENAANICDYSSVPPSKRQKTNPLPDDAPTLKPQIEVIDNYIQNAGGFGRLNPACEQPRFSLLRDACNNQDYFYLALHQMFCLWSMDGQSVRRIEGIEGFSDEKAVSYAFKVLGQLIRENNGLSPVHLRWFSMFPAPLSDLLRRSEHYRVTISSVSHFMVKLSAEWAKLTIQCQQRGYPPLVDELVEKLGLLSPVLQGVFFTATRRNMGILEDECGSQMEKVFTVDRDQHRQYTARKTTAHPPSNQAVQERNNRVINQYGMIRKQYSDKHESRRTSSASNSQFMIAQGTPPAVPTLMTFGSAQHVPQLVQQHFSSTAGTERSASFQTPHVLPSHGGHTSQADYTSSRIHTNQGPYMQYPNQLQSYHSPHNAITYMPQQSPQRFPAGPVFNSGYNTQSSSSVQASTASIGHSTYLPPDQTALPPTAMQPQSLPQITAGRQYDSNGLSLMSQRRPRPGHILTSNAPPPGSNSPQTGFASPSAFHITPMMASISSARVSPIVQHSPQNTKIHHEAALVPPQGYVLPAQPPNPDFTALHQAHLRSPLLVASTPSPYYQSSQSTRRYYQALKSFAVGPTRLSLELALSRFQFRVPEHLHAKISKDNATKSTSPKSREVRPGSLQYRIRCVRSKPGDEKCEPSTWVVTDTAWPPSVFLEINDHVLEVRRKQHYAKDLPVDITPHVLAQHPSRANHVTISIPKTGKTPKDMTYAFAVEMIEVLDHEQIMKMCLQNQRIPAKDTLDHIRKSLTGALADDDDEVVMIASDLTIDLADPFMAKIFDTPVRGKCCLHRECFDLETFLITRPSKPKHPEQPSMVDVWKCPLCGRDARPYSLCVDEFLVSVREKLARDGMLDCKTILVTGDGSWTIKPDSVTKKRHLNSSAPYQESDDEDEEGENEEVTTRASQVLTEKKPTGIEVIDLDDD